MNTPDPAEPRWRRRHWCLGLSFLIVLQIALIDRYEAPDTPARPTAAQSREPFAASGQIQISVETDPHRTVDPTAPSVDPAGPALFSLVHPRGFSGAIWEFMPKVEPPLIEWTEKPLWLPLDERRLGNTFPNTLQHDPAPDSRFKTPRTPIRLAPTPARTRLVRTQSVLRIAGPLTERPLIAQPAVPSLDHTNILGRTIVQTAVDADGFPVVRRGKERSGWPVADSIALDLARTVRFEPIHTDAGSGPRQLVWGDLIFQWNIQAPNPNTGTP